MSEARDAQDAQQAEALEAILAEFDGGTERGRLYAPTGWGKTVTAAQVWSKIGGSILVYVGPTRIGASQSAPTFLKYSQPGTRQIFVAMREKGPRGKRIGGMTVTRNASEIRDFLADASTPRQIFTTDTSLASVVTGVMRDGGFTADLLVVDEGHRNTAVRPTEGPDAVWAHAATSADRMSAHRRLYMTATPRHWTGGIREDLAIVTNDDDELFGPVLYECTYDKAVAAGIILPVQPLALGTADDEILSLFTRNPKLGQIWPVAPDQQLPYQEIAAHLAIYKARTEGLPVKDAGGERYYPQRIIVAFNAIPDAKAFARRHRGVMHALGLSEHIGAYSITSQDGSSASVRDSIRRHVADLEQDGHQLGHAIITFCRVLSESFDLPDLDMLVVNEPRNSTVDCMQTMGRIARQGLKSTKRFAYVVTTDVLGPGEDDIEGSTMVSVCRALVGLSETYKHSLQKPTGLPMGGSSSPVSRILTMDGRPMAADVEDRLTLIVLDLPRPGWFETEFLPHLDAYIAEHGDPGVPVAYVSADGYPLGRRVAYLRAIRTGTGSGMLTPERIAALDARGFCWSAGRPPGVWYAKFVTHYRDHWVPAHGTRVISRSRCTCGWAIGVMASAIRQADRTGSPERYLLSADQRTELLALGFDLQTGTSYAEARRRAIEPEVVRRYVKDRESAEQIAKATGRSVSHVYRVLREAGVPRRRRSGKRGGYPEGYADQLRERYEVGASQVELSRAEGLSKFVVRRLLTQAGTVFRNEASITKGQAASLRKRYEAGAGLEELAKAEGRPYNWVRRGIVLAGGTIRPPHVTNRRPGGAGPA